ncbi:hypothetical protein, partial [Pseudomonas sp. NW5]|uniref:hypothetical protein n=1 Tax=Pseudomonas sp. NW5 TaxID=2934934 RepID=UPI002022947C
MADGELKNPESSQAPDFFMSLQDDLTAVLDVAEQPLARRNRPGITPRPVSSNAAAAPTVHWPAA